ncbi:MAG: GldM family protein [Brumimicrobium sp.]
MGGGKQTPRQKMIELMYLVLTALLALNVSKDIVAAFVNLDEKLGNSAVVISGTTDNTYGTFDAKRAAIIAEKGDTKVIDRWQGKAEELKQKTKEIVHLLLSSSNDVIQEAEGVSWVESAEIENGDSLYTKLKSLRNIKNKENYDIATRLFVGDNPMSPNARGNELIAALNQYRNDVTELMGNYEQGNTKWTFTAPETIEGLKDALRTANPEDTTAIASLYKTLTIPKEVEILDAGQPKIVPWQSAMFDHAPVVASAAIFTSLKLDVLNGESGAADFMLSKVDAPTFNFNKIEPLAFARTGYINAGDSLNVRVMIAAYDSTDVPPIRYGLNDSIQSNWTETTGSIKVNGTTPGEYKLTGIIGVKEKGETVWKNWSYNYTVGKPSGTVSLPEMNVLYRGYKNKVVGAASGFPNYSLSGGGNVTLTRSSDGYVANPGSGREATINIAGVAEDGSSSNLGGFKFRVRNLPKPSLRLGRIEDGEAATSAEIRASRQLFAGYGDDIPLNATFSVVSWEINVTGAPRPAKGNGAALSAEAMRLLNNVQSGGTVSIFSQYKGPDGRVNRQGAVIKVK